MIKPGTRSQIGTLLLREIHTEIHYEGGGQPLAMRLWTSLLDEMQAPVTREGQLIFFFQFLHVGGRWEEFLRDCPLLYTGNHGSGALNVLGTVLLSVLSGH